MPTLSPTGEKTLFFLHIPRTGGTSLMHYLDRKFDKAEICPAHEMFEFERLQRVARLLALPGTFRHQFAAIG